jgi:CBS domain-containing protein
MKAKNIMTENPITIPSDATIRDLVNLFNDRRLDWICVVEGDNKLVGVITIFELLKAFLPEHVKMKQELAQFMHEGYFEKMCTKMKSQPVSSIMRTDLVPTREEDNLIKIVADIVRYRLMAVPVTRGEKLVGAIYKKGLLGYTGKMLIDNRSDESDKGAE